MIPGKRLAETSPFVISLRIPPAGFLRLTHVCSNYRESWRATCDNFAIRPLSQEKVNPRSASPSVKRAFGYVVSTVFASLFYIAWIFCEVLWSSHDAHQQFITTFGASILFFLIGGFGLVFLPLILPWAVTVSAFRKARCTGKVYFTLVGAMLIFVIGCLTSTLMPKPLFVEDQTFFQGVVLAVKREGIGFALAGCVFGASYWFLCERHSVPACKKTSPAVAD